LSDTQVRSRIAALVAIPAVFAFCWFYRDTMGGGPVLCPLRFFMGIPCPGCGLTRSFCCLIHLELWSAVKYHVLGPVVFCGMVLAVPYLACELARRRRITFLNPLLFSTKVAYLVGFGLISYHVVRLCLFFAGGGFPESNSVVGMIVLWVAGGLA